VTVGYKGDLRVEATFGRERHHYSSPFPTAGDAAVSWASAVGRWACDRSGGTPYRSVTAKVVELSTGPLGDDETARVTIDVRLPPGTSVRAAWSDLPRDPGHPRLRVRAAIDPCEPGAQDPVARAFLASIREEGARPTVWKKAGTSDLNLAIGAWAVPGAAYGPGDSRLDHTANESLALDELLRSVRVLRRTFRTVASGLGRLPTPRGPGAVP
jgi:LysW-gamma-L-lysine carboxypeptidase